MARAKKVIEEEGLNRFAFFNEMKTGNKFADSNKDDEVTFISTGCYAFNAAYSGDMTLGFPSNRVVMLAGEEAVGKTFFTIYGHILQLHREGYFIFYVDTENAVTGDMLESFGIVKGGYKIIRESTVEKARETIAKILDNIEEAMGKATVNKNKCAFALDSMGQLTTMKSMNDASSGVYTRDFTKQSELKRFFAVLTNRMGLLDIPLIMTNHVYQSMGSFISTKEIAGGSGGLYASSVILEMRKKQMKEGTVRTGSIITAKVKKSRWVREGKEVSFYLDFEKGLNPWYGVHALAEEAGLLKEYNSEFASMGVKKPGGANGNAKIWVCIHPDKDATEWVTCLQKDLHKKSTIGSIFEPVNEWVKVNFKLSKGEYVEPVETDDEDDTDLDVEVAGE